ncbi:sugar ABC transporter substrate-binding protein [Paraoerskovia sediminicola]|uniref:Sugar ABC transporter substrate-binding protein n=1 Tax=Paraoerskovia sediminicola TaxID=1138587 RepID=A0ABN6XFZ3_9CELL|nr:extracellular solute-binding protein [Paraoerskovia sediminicola]BDZ43719.1 sugar ABC transporter substrate-binding protein [Paraoerskovia sediminicola]
MRRRGRRERHAQPRRGQRPDRLGAAAGVVPDAARRPDARQSRCTADRRGWGTLPLTDYGISTDGYADGVVQAGTYEDDLYGVVPVVNSLALFYNQDLLDAAGVTPPTTWDELESAAASLTDGDTYGVAFSGTNTFEGTWQFLPFMWSNGGHEDDLTAPETVEALDLVTRLVDDGSASQSVVTWSQNDVNDQFIAGKAAMMVNGPWNLPSLDAAEGLSFDVVTIPTRTAEQDPVAPLGGEAFTVPNTGDADRMAAAGEFVDCIVGDDHQLTMATGRGAVPSRTEVADQAAADEPLIAAFVDTVQTARARTALLGTQWPDAATRIYTAEQLALTGEASPSEALAQAQDQ